MLKMNALRASNKIVVQKIKDFLYPLTRKQKEKRFRQIMDVSIFFTSIIMFIYFEDKIANILLVNPEDVKKLSQNQSGKDN